MKKGLLLVAVALTLALPACKSDELLRVERVVGGYDYTSTCEVHDLIAQGTPTTVLDSSVLYVVRPLEDEDGFISLLDDQVYLDKDLEFSKSIVNYSISGKFDGNGGLTIRTDIVDLDVNTRTICNYTCTLQ